MDRILQEEKLLAIEKVPRVYSTAVQDVIAEKILISQANSEKELELINISSVALAEEALRKIEEESGNNLRRVFNATGLSYILILGVLLLLQRRWKLSEMVEGLQQSNCHWIQEGALPVMTMLRTCALPEQRRRLSLIIMPELFFWL